MELAEGVSELVRAEAFEDDRQRKSARLTVQQFGELWTTGKLYETHGQVRGLKPKKSASDDAIRLRAHAYPYLTKPVADVTEQDIERCMAEASKAAEKKRGKPWRQATRLQLYQALRRLFDLAVKPGRRFRGASARCLSMARREARAGAVPLDARRAKWERGR